MKARDESAATPSEAEIRAALERLVVSPALRASPQLVSFLRFVVEATLAGDAARIKEYSIAIGALGRSHTFDPKTNPIVRVEAGRLRRGLERYYTGSGWRDPTMIEIPRGNYVPIFVRRGTVYGVWTFALRSRQLIPRTVWQVLQLVVFAACGVAAAIITLDLAFMLAERAAP